MAEPLDENFRNKTILNRNTTTCLSLRSYCELSVSRKCCNNKNNNNNNNKITCSRYDNNSVNVTRRRQHPLTPCLLIVMTIIMKLVQMPTNTRVSASVITTYHHHYQQRQHQQQQQQQRSLLSSASAQEDVLHLTPPSNSVSTKTNRMRTHTLVKAKSRRTRLRKRHSYYLHFPYDDMPESSAAIVEWQNPCGGVFEQQQRVDTEDDTFQRPPVRYYLKQLRRSTGLEYRTINETLRSIDISDLAVWRLHRNRYKFLPTLKANSSITLKRWYQNMQTFVGAFAYLSKIIHASPITQELHELLMSARRLLCEIETTINGSYPRTSKLKLTHTTRESMNKRFKFYTQIQNEGIEEFNEIDLKYAKDAYYSYVLNMWKILRRHTRRRQRFTSSEPPPPIDETQLLSSVEENISSSDNNLINEENVSQSESIETF